MSQLKSASHYPGKKHFRLDYESQPRPVIFHDSAEARHKRRRRDLQVGDHRALRGFAVGGLQADFDELLELDDVFAEVANVFGGLFGGHGVFVEEPAEVFSVAAHALNLQGLGAVSSLNGHTRRGSRTDRCVPQCTDP